MTDGGRSLIGMCAGCFCAVLAAWLYLGGVVILYPSILLYGGLFLFYCTLVGGLAGYCLGAEDGDDDEDKQNS
jgi:hypothetical protein